LAKDLSISFNKNISFSELATEVSKKEGLSAIIFDRLNASPSLYKFLCSKGIEDLVKKLFNTKKSIFMNNFKLLVQNPGNEERTNFPWHQDSHYNTLGESADKSIVIWVSLIDIDSETGPVVFKKGSNALGIVDKISMKRPSGHNIFTVNEKHIDVAAFEDTAPKINAGDLLLIDMNVIHKSGTNLTNKTKFTMTSRCHIF